MNKYHIAGSAYQGCQLWENFTGLATFSWSAASWTEPHAFPELKIAHTVH